jgi:hypothetical protein
MRVSMLAKTGQISEVDEKLINLLGYSTNSWLGKRLIDYLYKNDSYLLLKKLCELNNKIESANLSSNLTTENIGQQINIEPFYLRFKYSYFFL